VNAERPLLSTTPFKSAFVLDIILPLVFIVSELISAILGCDSSKRIMVGAARFGSTIDLDLFIPVSALECVGTIG